MKNSSTKGKRLRGYFLAFLIVALAFLAVGMGTLGSFYGTGSAYELRAQRSSDNETPSVTFSLENYNEKDEKGNNVTTNFVLEGVYVNLAQIYAEAGTPVTLRVERATRTGTFSTNRTASFENFFTRTEDDNGRPLDNVAEPDVTAPFFRFASPFVFDSYWRVDTYPRIRISINGTDAPNVLINEIVFWGQKCDSSNVGRGEYAVIPATVTEATPINGESSEQALARAAALVDSSHSPLFARSSYHCPSEAELSSLMTIAEMRMGNSFAADAAGNALDTYHIDTVYGALGQDVLALGTLIFGNSLFGLRFFPMLAAFGVLVVLSRLTVRLTKSERAGFVFGLIFALSCLTFGYGRLGTPLMLGIFCFACSLSLTHRFYADGIKRATFLSVMPLLAAGLFGAAAISVNGAFLIPVLGVVGLFVAGMVRQQTAKRYRLEKALSEETASEAPMPEAEADETDASAPETPAVRAGRVAAEYKFKNAAAPVLFGTGLVIGTLLFALIGMLCGYFVYIKGFDDPAAPSMNVFSLAWKAFAGGFAGKNFYGVQAWHPFALLFAGDVASESTRAVTLAALNPAALLISVLGIVYAAVRLVRLLLQKEHDKAWRAELRRILLPLAGLVLSLIACAVATPNAFVLLAYLFAFMLAAVPYAEGEKRPAATVALIVGAVLLAVGFALLFAFVFSVPLPVSLLGKLGL